ncbi:hypothetical protein CJD36_004470 [Flavipsychrobacter stenotrophus]|uniref:DUF928 domain-containing protein n=1 Tax=Flavipsychrobacter stenotrophus TaxID=2077091 RepID=A0A2S7T217_9BACT|nr:hypothetical protein [Flavipsychrobacter stenotrophus]PQJ13004.1 hypothetical protein CJD36_004470 [Flavipsychrobacter stenotrophus]
MKRTINSLGNNLLLLLCCLLFTVCASAQQNLVVDLSPVDGINLTPENILNFRLQALGTNVGKVQITGTVRFRNSPQNFSYSFKYDLHTGMNTIDAGQAHPQWQFSSSALKELFFNYKTLPEGTYEYCVSVAPISAHGEVSEHPFDECLYHKSDEVFLINLLEPENKAKIHEYTPMLSWVANYSFSNELTYRLRVAEIKQGQNPVNAVMRNQPVYDEKNLMQNSKVYPIYARPLVKNQPYAWTVDAYYKGILLGGAETWQFTIVDESPITGPPVSRSYIDIRKENGAAQLYATGEIKLKYDLDKGRRDTLILKLVDEKGKEHTIKPNKLPAQYGDNRYTLDLMEKGNLKHQHQYRLLVATKSGEHFAIPFEYINPDFTR